LIALDRRRKLGLLAGCAACAALLWSGACPAQDDEERPRIFLEKKVYSSATESGQRVFFETKTVEEGDTVWKILTGRGTPSPEQYAAQLKEFRRINPSVADPDHLEPGQKVHIPLQARPAGESALRAGRAVEHVIAKGQSLSRILRARGVSRKEMPKYLGAVKALNPSIRNVDRIMAGKTIFLPTDNYFRPAEATPPPSESAPAAAEAAADAPKLVEAPPVPAPEPPPAAAVVASAAPSVTQAVEPVAEPVKDAPPSQPAPSGETSPETPPAALTREAPAGGAESEIPVGKPDAQLGQTSEPPSAEPPPSSVTGKAPKAPDEPPKAPERPAYRGLLADVAAALGEKWLDRGTLYLPMSAGGEVVINLADFPVVRFGSGAHALIDFRGTLPSAVRTLVSDTWRDYRIVALDSVPGPGERIDRLLAASGYALVKDGLAKPLVIGESVAVTLPSRWQLFRTPQALEAGDVTLVKEVPEKLPDDLDAVLTYAGRIGIRVLPVAYDRSTREGFLAGLAERKKLDAPDPNRLPSGILPALDAALAFLKIPAEVEPTLRMSGKDDAFRLVIRPDRVFTLDGTRYVVDTGRMSPAIRSIVKGAGYRIFEMGKGDSGKLVFLKLLKAAGHSYEERRRFRLAGGPDAGFDLHVTGTFVTSKALLEARSVRALVVVKGRQHAATRAMLREMGIEVVELTD
jgi:hypothetical protein